MDLTNFLTLGSNREGFKMGRMTGFDPPAHIFDYSAMLANIVKRQQNCEWLKMWLQREKHNTFTVLSNICS